MLEGEGRRFVPAPVDGTWWQDCEDHGRVEARFEGTVCPGYYYEVGACGCVWVTGGPEDRIRLEKWGRGS